jgi:hypothetical protein
MSMADSPARRGRRGTEVTESWRNQRVRGAHVLGRVFTGKVANNRAEANRAGMRTTLAAEPRAGSRLSRPPVGGQPL